MRRRGPVRWVGVLLALLWTGPLIAQSLLEDRLRQVDSLSRAGDAFGPGRLLAAALATAPQSYPVLWRGARDGVMLSLLRDERNEVNAHVDRAIQLGRRAVVVDPTGRDGAYWLAAALARRAQRSGVVDALRASRESYTIAASLVARDSLDAGAHALVGRLHVALLDVPRPVRALALLGVHTDGVTCGSAERHLRRAVALEPTSVAYRTDLVHYLMRCDRLTLASREATQITNLPVRTPADTFLQRDIAGRVAAAHAARGTR